MTFYPSLDDGLGTDAACRYFHRLLAPQARLHRRWCMQIRCAWGSAPPAQVLGAREAVDAQLGAVSPAVLAQATRICWDEGFDEVNLNVGCPSDRVQSGRFGA